MGRVYRVSHSLAGIQARLLHSVTQYGVVPAFEEDHNSLYLSKSMNQLVTDHVHDVPEAAEAGPFALAGGDLEVAGNAAAFSLSALERSLDQAVGHRVVPVIRVGQELQAGGEWVSREQSTCLERYIFVEIALSFLRIIRIVVESVFGHIHDLHSDSKLIRSPRSNADT